MKEILIWMIIIIMHSDTDWEQTETFHFFFFVVIYFYLIFIQYLRLTADIPKSMCYHLIRTLQIRNEFYEFDEFVFAFSD